MSHFVSARPDGRSVRRRTLLSEYGSMIGLMQSVAGGVCWLYSSWEQPAGLAMVVASIWLFRRSTGWHPGTRWCPALTMGAIILTRIAALSANRGSSLVFLQAGPLSADALLMTLLIVLIADLVDLRARNQGIRP